jgi:hypothetical protein
VSSNGSIGTRARKSWGVVRHILSVRGLLQWTGWWQPVSATASALAVGIGTWFKGHNWPVALLLALTGFALVSIIWRAFRPFPEVPLPPAHPDLPDTPQPISLKPRLEFGFVHNETLAVEGMEAFPRCFVIDVKNAQTAIANTAGSVTARIQFVHVDGSNFTVPSAAWIVRRIGKQGYIEEGISSTVDLEGGEELMFTLALIKRDGTVMPFRNLEAPAGICGVGHWVAHVRILSNNATPLEGSIGFTVLRENAVQFDQPAFLTRSDHC